MRIVDLNDPNIAAVERSWRIGGVAILIATFLVSGGHLYVYARVWYPFICLGGHLMLRGRKLGARALAAHISKDELAPVIYLIAFKSEASLLQSYYMAFS